MLERFRKSKQREIESLLALAEKGQLPAPAAFSRPSFSGALKKNGFGVIAEYKRASPSRGIIRGDIEVEEAARQYKSAGASAVSILTEEDWFQGDFQFIDRAKAAIGNTPVLRKDFIFDPVQIIATASSMASAVLLIVRCVPDARKLALLREEAKKHSLECVVEVFDKDDLAIARESGAEIVQVNARDLDKLTVDRSACLNLIQDFPPKPHETWIAASGISEPEHLRAARNSGFHAALVGSSLMEAGEPGASLARLLKGLAYDD